MDKLILKKHFFLDSGITFLNHGSFGATPKSVMREYQKWQNYSEIQPVKFYGRQVNGLLADHRKDLADYLHVAENDIVFVPNATTGINIVARSLNLSSNDTVLTTDHEYGAVDKTWVFLAEKANFSIQVNQVTVPIINDDQITEDVFCNISSRVKVLSISHITSPTALIFPIKKICAIARQKGILTVIDGAHAPGQIDLNLNDLNCDFYIGNLHKWLCAPKGSAFLYAHPRVQSLIQPLIVSWGWQCETPGVSQFIDNLEWTGTRDISAYLAVPEAISFCKANIHGKPQEKCHQLAVATHFELAKITRNAVLSPRNGQYFNQMAASIIRTQKTVEELKSILYDTHKIEIPVIYWKGNTILRYSFQIYNNEEDMKKLVSAVKKLVA